MDPTPDRVIVKKLKEYDPCLQVSWDRDRERWAVQRKDTQTGKVWHIFFVNSKNGEYRPLDERIIDEIYQCDIWKHFKNGVEFHKFLQEKNFKVKKKHEDLRRDYIRWWNKEHKNEWRAAIENAQRGVIDMPQKTEAKIYSLPSQKEES